MLSIVAWGMFAARAGLPVSKSHALLAGLAGAAFAKDGIGALQWVGWEKVIIGMLLSVVLGCIVSYIIGIVVIALTGASKPVRTKRLFDRLSVVAACFLAFNHGLNDGQKFMGVFATTLLTGGVLTTFEIPFWVIMICALTMALGTSAGGWRIIQTLGSRMTRLQSWQGFAAQTAAGFTIFGASSFGVPLSTTHTITSAIVGAAASRRMSDIRWVVLRRIVLAWLITFPVCFVAAFAAARLASSLH
jgi:PiT family inorganic phosphate transporter